MSDIQLNAYDNIENIPLDGTFESISYTRNKAKKSADSNIGVLKIVFFILCALLVIEGVAYKFVIPLTHYPKIHFEGVKSYSEQELVSEIYKNQASSWFNFDVNKATAILTSKSCIEGVSIVKHFPDLISISVVEREPVAIAFLTVNERSVPVQIDKNGVLFTTNTENPVSDRTIPIVSGLPVEHLTGGMRIPQKYLGLIDQIAKIRSLPQKYFAAISEINVVTKAYGNYELVLYPVGSRTKVLTDRSLSEEALQYMMVVLDIVKSFDSSVSEIDLRYGSVSYRTENGGK